jgi:hypothetical protein
MRLETEADARRVVGQTRRILAGVAVIVLTGLSVGVLVPIREIGRTWAHEDVVECQASAFVAHAGASGGPAAGEAAMRECVTRRRAKRWGPWRAFGNADDASKYNAAED